MARRTPGQDRKPEITLVPDPAPVVDKTVRKVVIHGHERAYVMAGSGPAILLLHGLACDHHTWDAVIDELARDHTVIAPDMLGHGESAKPRADYSVGGFANGMRDLLTVLGIPSATVVGHSFGGGVAMQFAYQFPERTDRLVLVAPGGIGPEVTRGIRMMTLPLFSRVAGLATLPGVRDVNDVVLRALSRLDLRHTRDLDEVADILIGFRDPAFRAAIAHVVRACVDWKGQIITVADRAYLTTAMPMCVVWGTEDIVIPASHAEIVEDIAPGAEVELITRSGHFPHKDRPAEFVRIVRDFIASTDPADYDRSDWRELLADGPTAPAVRERAGERPQRPVVRSLRRRTS